MHCSIWTYVGDPAQLAAGYAAMIEQMPAENMRFHAAARTSDGLVIFDTCPSKDAFEAFYGSPEVQAVMSAHGLGRPVSVVDAPIIRAFAGGARVDAS
jgi:hypothetical protein